MEVVIDITADNRTPEQNDNIDLCYQAAKLLRQNGFKAKTILYCTFDPDSRPAHIIIEKP